MYSNGQPAGVSKSYVDWILSPAGQAIVKEQGFVPLSK
jgi:ABC-type phosphate transport system substrate-binding protein